MTPIEKSQSLLILGAVLVGLALGQIPEIAGHAATLILPLLIAMLTGVFLSMPLHGLKKVFQFRSVAIASLIINFFWTPLFAWLLGGLFLRDQPALWVGFLMLMVTPCTDWYLVFTSISKGNLQLSTALLPINLSFQLILLPIYLFLLAGTLIPLKLDLVLKSTVLVLVLPFFTANILRYLFSRYRWRFWFEQRLLPVLQPTQIFLLSLAIVAVFASEGHAVLQQPTLLLQLFPPVLIFFSSNLALAYLISKWLNSSYANFVSLSFTTLARNSPIALAIAVVAFPNEPFVALALVIGPLIELPVLSLISHVLLWVRQRGQFPDGQCVG